MRTGKNNYYLCLIIVIRFSVWNVYANVMTMQCIKGGNECDTVSLERENDDIFGFTNSSEEQELWPFHQKSMSTTVVLGLYYVKTKLKKRCFS